MRILKKALAHKGKTLFSVALLALLASFALRGHGETDVTIDPDNIRPAEKLEHSHSNVVRGWDAERPTDVRIEIGMDEVSDDAFDGTEHGYAKDVLELSRNDAVTIDVYVENRGIYHVSFDQKDIGQSILPSRIAFKVNGEHPFQESESIELPTHWEFDRTEFQTDRYGHEIMPTSSKRDAFIPTHLYDTTALNSRPLEFLLEEGWNTVEITMLAGNILLGDFRVESVKDHLDYESYLSLHEDASPVAKNTITVGAENMSWRTNPSTRLTNVRDASATSYDTRHLRLNALDGQSFRKGNDIVTYSVEVEEAGFYHLAFKYRQDHMMDMPTFREIRINNEVPFEEVTAVPFHYTRTFENFIPNDGDRYFQFYLEEGHNEISLRAVMGPYRNAYEHLVVLMEEMTELSLEVKRLTGGVTDRYRTWRLRRYIPDVEERIEAWIETLEHVAEGLSKYSPAAEPGEVTNITIAIEQLEKLLTDADEIPNRLRLLAEGDNSAAAFLGTVIQNLLENGLTLESIHVSSTTDFPASRANIFVRSYESTKRFFLSFTVDDYQIGDTDEDVLEVWVNHPRQYVEIMQQLVDTQFTPATGIDVKLSLMPDENKLILANAAGTAPDVALGVNHWLPYEFAIRNASLDLRQFEGYEETVDVFAPGMMVPYAFEEGMYGLPQTQNFWVTFYRTDVVESLDIPVPETWDEVTSILPELQRHGMNYYHPMALHGGFKPFVATIPFIYQFGGELYSEDGMRAALNTEEMLEGMNLMTELFTIYNLPKQVPNFYNHFRFGTLPIGISDLATYLQLTVAAPELQGKWEIALHPGVEQSDGEIIRWAASGAQSSMILSNTEQPDKSWEFLSWWMSTTIQTEFAHRLQTAFGTEFLWNTANLEAFRDIPLPPHHIDVILEQWEFALEASRVPGAYMVEREISNAWNKIVFDDVNPRIALDEAVRVSNREIIYRMEEFGYAWRGEPLRDYRVPTIRNIDYWLKEHDDD